MERPRLGLLRQAANQVRQYPETLVPWGMTLSRPVLTEISMRAYERGWRKISAAFLGLAGLSDAEGTAIKVLNIPNARTEAGAMADPIADRTMAAQVLTRVDIPKLPKRIITAAEGLISIGSIALLALAGKSEQKKVKPQVRTVGKARMVVHIAGAAALVLKDDDERVRNAAGWAMAGASVTAAVDYFTAATRQLRNS